jgi:riboflavin biosynthesis pyrimidine reductase
VNKQASESRALSAAGARLLVLPGDPLGRVQLSPLLHALSAAGVRRLMVEGGARVIAAFLASRLVDQVILTIAPRYLGGYHITQAEKTTTSGLQSAFPRLSQVAYERLGDDLIVWGKPNYQEEGQ